MLANANVAKGTKVTCFNFEGPGLTSWPGYSPKIRELPSSTSTIATVTNNGFLIHKQIRKREKKKQLWIEQNII